MMTAQALFEGEEVLALIPQRKPMVMLDTFYEGTDTEALTGLTVQADNLFCNGRRLTEPGLIEHIAQSASALAGYTAWRNHQPAPTGYIGEVRKCRIFRLPEVGEQLRTSVSIISEVMNVSLLSAETKSEDNLIASCQMKIYLEK